MQDIWEVVALHGASIGVIDRVCRIDKKYVAAIKLQRFTKALMLSRYITFYTSSGRIVRGRRIRWMGHNTIRHRRGHHFFVQ